MNDRQQYMDDLAKKVGIQLEDQARELIDRIDGAEKPIDGVKKPMLSEDFFVEVFGKHFEDVINGKPSDLWPAWFECIGGTSIKVDISMNDGTVLELPPYILNSGIDIRSAPDEPTLGDNLRVTDLLMQQKSPAASGSLNNVLSKIAERVGGLNNSEELLKVVSKVLSRSKGYEVGSKKDKKESTLTCSY